MINTLGLRSWEQRRADARLIMFYKIVFGLVSISFPPYCTFRARSEWPGIKHPYHFIQIHSSANYHKFSFCSFVHQAVEQPLLVALSDDLTAFRLFICSKKMYAINLESLFSLTFKFLLLSHTNTILLFSIYLTHFNFRLSYLSWCAQLNITRARACCRVYRKKYCHKDILNISQV